MNKYIQTLIILSCLILSFSTQAQELVFGYSLGYGKYQLGDIKSLQENDIKNNVKEIKDYYERDFQYKSPETFPDGLFHDAYAGIKFSFHEIGLKYDYFTTGGRNQIIDYSGELRKDLILSGDALGIYYKIHFLSLPVSKACRLTANAGVATGAIYNKTKYSYFFDLNNSQHLTTPYIDDYSKFEKIDETYKGSSVNWYVQPNLGVQLWFKNTVSLNLNAGYLLDSPGKIKTADKNTIVISYAYSDSYSSYVYTTGYPGREYDFGANWSGLRLSAGIGFTFSIAK
jgi:hypothetical protein